jgi:hypothetical protein
MSMFEKFTHRALIAFEELFERRSRPPQACEQKNI